jgi:hypothetical protein
MNAKNEALGSIMENMDSENKVGNSNVRSVVLATLALWLGLVCFLGAHGTFAGRPGSPPLPIFLGLAIPLAVFFTAYLRWPAFRTFILGADLRFVIAIQAWRWAGQHFLWLRADGVLPGLFAFPVGLADMAIGITAPLIVLGLARSPSFATSRRFVIWNILGIVDFVFAFSMAILSSGLFPEITRFNGNVTTEAMAHLPLVLTPAYLVPFFTMLHCTALFQARQLSRSAKSAERKH